MTGQGCEKFRNSLIVEIYLPHYSQTDFVETSAVMLRHEASVRSAGEKWQFTFKTGAML